MRNIENVKRAPVTTNDRTLRNVSNGEPEKPRGVPVIMVVALMVVFPAAAAVATWAIVTMEYDDSTPVSGAPSLRLPNYISQTVCKPNVTYNEYISPDLYSVRATSGGAITGSSVIQCHKS